MVVTIIAVLAALVIGALYFWQEWELDKLKLDHAREFAGLEAKLMKLREEKDAYEARLAYYSPFITLSCDMQMRVVKLKPRIEALEKEALELRKAGRKNYEGWRRHKEIRYQLYGLYRDVYRAELKGIGNLP